MTLGLPIRMWVRYRSGLMLDAEIRATSDELCSFELYTIVCQDSSGHTESIYDTRQELDHYLLGYIHRWHDFHPLGERVDSNE
jgi:hypothetical protein